ncbi:MAG TPA: FmdB family zinc ribbon protein [Candidatus Dormibacteraeota bacterium]
MPTYGYRCSSCGTEFDVWQPMSGPAGAECAKCGQPAQRLFFAPAIVFNGSGFYKTDSRSASKSGGSTAKSPASGGPASAAAPAAPAASSSDAGAAPTSASPQTKAPSPD